MNPFQLEKQLYFNRLLLNPWRHSIKLFHRLREKNPARWLRFCVLALVFFRSYLSLAGAVHHCRWPQDTVVILIQEAVFGSQEVFQHKHRLELAVFAITKISDIVSLDIGAVYILIGMKRKTHNFKIQNFNKNISWIVISLALLSEMLKCSDRWCAGERQQSFVKCRVSSGRFTQDS